MVFKNIFLYCRDLYKQTILSLAWDCMQVIIMKYFVGSSISPLEDAHLPRRPIRKKF